MLYLLKIIWFSWYFLCMKKTVKKTLFDVNTKLVSMQDKIFQTKEQEIHNWLISVATKKLWSLPLSIRTISFSLFLFIFWWWLGADTFFSIYIKNIVNDVLGVSLIGALFPLMRLLFSLPIWELNDNTDRKSVIFLSKMMYIICWLLFFFAGILKNPWILLGAVIFNGIASATLFITYESYIRSTIDNSNSGHSWWFYFSSLNAALVIWAILSSLLIKWIDLPFLFLFIVLFTLISLFTDRKIPLIKKNEIKEIFSKKHFLIQFIRKVFSFKPFVKTFSILKHEPRSFLYSLGFEWLFNILNYIWFLFIPLAAVANNLSLTQIALLFALMKLPYLTNFLTVSWSDRFNKKLFIAIILLLLSFLYAILAFDLSFLGIMTVSFWISIWLSIIRPIISSLISEHTTKNNTGSVTGVQMFIAGVWSIVGSIGFWIFSGIFGMKTTFFLVGISVFVLSIWGISKKMSYKLQQKATIKNINSM